MARFGRNPFPRQFGGGLRALEFELQGQLDDLAPGYDVNDESLVYAECYAYAVALDGVWKINWRSTNQEFPMRMQEMLPVWERILRIRVPVESTLIERRRVVAGRFLGLGGNTTGDVYDAVAGLLGDRLEDLSGPSEPDEWAYYPGIMPGPPGYEWCSNRAAYYVTVDRDGLDTAGYLRLISQVADLLENVIRSDMTYVIGVNEGGFQADIGQAGVTMV